MFVSLQFKTMLWMFQNLSCLDLCRNTHRARSVTFQQFVKKGMNFFHSFACDFEFVNSDIVAWPILSLFVASRCFKISHFSFSLIILEKNTIVLEFSMIYKFLCSVFRSIKNGSVVRDTLSRYSNCPFYAWRPIIRKAHRLVAWRWVKDHRPARSLTGIFLRRRGHSYAFPRALRQLALTAALSCVAAGNYSCREKNQQMEYLALEKIYTL